MRGGGWRGEGGEWRAEGGGRGNLHDGEKIGKLGGVDVHGSEEGKELVSRRVGEKLEVVRSVLVVRGDKERNHALKECLGGRVIREERVAVDPIELTFTWVGAAADSRGV